MKKKYRVAPRINKKLLILLPLLLISTLFPIFYLFQKREEEKIQEKEIAWDFRQSIKTCGDLPKEILGLGEGPKMGDYTSPSISKKIWSPDCTKIVYSLISANEDREDEGVWLLTISRTDKEAIIEKKELIPFSQIQEFPYKPSFSGWLSNEAIILETGGKEYHYNLSTREIEQ